MASVPFLYFILVHVRFKKKINRMTGTSIWYMPTLKVDILSSQKDIFGAGSQLILQDLHCC